MSVHPARKALYLAVVTAFIVVFCGYTPAGAFNNEPVDNTLLLAQQTQESANEQSKTSGDEILDPANEPVELPGLRLSLLMAQQTQK